MSLFFFLDYAFSLRCERCFSDVSWQDCNQQITYDECDAAKTICIKAHRMFLMNSGRRLQRFIKACYFPEMCATEECRETGRHGLNASWCEVQCCDQTDFCNEGVTPSWEKAYGDVFGNDTTIHKPSRLRFLIIAVIFLFVLWK